MGHPSLLKVKRLDSLGRFSLNLPGSKSLTQRALLCSALSQEESRISHFLISEDTLLLKEALSQVGVSFEELDEDGERVWLIKGKPFPELKKQRIFFGNNGTGSRLFLAYASLGKGEYLEIYGKKRLHERPLEELACALLELGASFEFLEKKFYFPLKVFEGELKGKSVKISGKKSSQFISALLFIGPLLSQGIEIEIVDTLVSRGYVDMTISMMKLSGIEVEFNEERTFFSVKEGKYKGINFFVPPDASSSSYFAILPALFQEGEVIFRNFDFSFFQPDLKIFSLLKEIGLEVYEDSEKREVRVRAKEIPSSFDINIEDSPDLFPTLCVLASFCKGESRIYGAPHLRYKETDRILAMFNELSKVEIKTEVLPDGMKIWGNPDLKLNEEVLIETYDDHRIAMAFTVLGLRTGNILIKDPGCVKKSFPEFWDFIERLYEKSG